MKNINNNLNFDNYIIENCNINNNFQIDTITLSTQIVQYQDVYEFAHSDFNYICNTFNQTKENKLLIYYYNFDIFRLKYIYAYNVLHITFSPSELIKKDNFTYSDLDLIYKKVRDKIQNEFPLMQDIDYNNLQLNRIDYKLDLQTEHINTYLKLHKKLTQNYDTLKQNKRYKTSVYYKSASKNINIYDKEQERTDKNKEVLAEHHNLLRYELQLKRPYLDNQLYNRNYGGTKKDLFNYITSIDAEFHLKKVFENIIYTGDYYNLYHSKKVLKVLSEHYSNKTVNNLIEFQKQISLSDIDTVKKSMSYQNFYNKIKKLNYAKVNPILIPKNEEITYLSNPIFTDKHTYNKLEIA